MTGVTFLTPPVPRPRGISNLSLNTTNTADSTATALNPSNANDKRPFNMLQRRLSPYPEKYESESDASFSTYASTTGSDDGYALTRGSEQIFATDAIPASSKDFAELFPSSRTLSIRHDDATLDGNMNLRVDTQATTMEGEDMSITLFHLRMYDLKTREFSLRRYCRDSGREVAHSSIKSTSGRRRKSLNRHSLSNPLHIFKPHKQSTLRRTDSGYDSLSSDQEEDNHRSSSPPSKQVNTSASDVINLEFSNYAHVNLRRRGLKADKKFDFEYWGVNYSWQKTTKSTAESDETEFHLIRHSDGQAVAHITQDKLSPEEIKDEAEMGGWIPPCSMWISDQCVLDAQADVADTVVTTGLVALVDDSIRGRFHAKEGRHVHIPLPSLPSLKVDGATPKSLIDDTFGRQTRKPGTW